MSQITTQFRSSFNGYNREDVVDFIDRMTHAHEDALDRLQKANAKLKEELAEANEALSGMAETPALERRGESRSADSDTCGGRFRRGDSGGLF